MGTKVDWDNVKSFFDEGKNKFFKIKKPDGTENYLTMEVGKEKALRGQTRRKNVVSENVVRVDIN
jgi:hypothetical protein